MTFKEARMRNLIAAAAVAALVSPAAAQQARPPGPQKPAPSAQQRAAQPPVPPPVFPCRTAKEVCFLGVVTGNNEVAVLFTNAPQTEGIDAKPIAVLTGDSPGAAGSATKMDLAAHLGRVVMLTGTYDREAGLTKAELVEVASPLVSLTVKAQLGAEEPPPPQRGGKPPPKR
jgi:hypothetical protein